MKNLEDGAEKGNSLSFLQRCLKVPMLFLGVIIDESLRKYEKLFNLVFFLALAILSISSSAFLLTTNNVEYRLDSMLCTGAILLTFYSLWKFKRHSNLFCQIYHKSVSGERTSLAFLEICVKNLKKNLFVNLQAFAIILSLIVMSVILALSFSSNISYGSPAHFYHPAKYPWPMDVAGWYYFSVIFNFTASAPHVCAFIALEQIIVFLRVIIQTHQHLILVKVKNLDNLAAKKRTCFSGHVWPDDVMMDELRDIIKYHQFFMKLIKLIVKICEVFMDYIVIMSIWICVLALASLTVSTSFLMNLRPLIFIIFSGSVFFFGCFYSNELSEMNDSIMVALYNSVWYEQNLEYRRDFLIFLNSCAKPVQVKILGMHDVKLDFITVTLKRVYSTLQVLIKTIK